jgi:hypothetical protein
MDIATLAPSDIPDRADEIRTWIIGEGYSSEESLMDPASPQSLALDFMVEDMLFKIPNEASSEDESFAWMQRYVASILYFALDGENWTLQLHFLDHTLDTCSWFVSLGIAQAFGVFCDATSMRVTVIQIGKAPSSFVSCAIYAYFCLNYFNHAVLPLLYSSSKQVERIASFRSWAADRLACDSAGEKLVHFWHNSRQPSELEQVATIQLHNLQSDWYCTHMDRYWVVGPIALGAGAKHFLWRAAVIDGIHD